MTTATKTAKTFTLVGKLSSVEFTPLGTGRVRIIDYVWKEGRGWWLSSVTTMDTTKARELYRDLLAKGYRTF